MIERLGRQFFDAVRHVLGEVLRAGLIAAVVGLALAELAGGIIDGRWPGRPFVHVIAVAFALVLGYAVAMTVAFFEGVRGIVSTATQIEGEIEGVIRGTVDASSARIMDVVDSIEHRPQHRQTQPTLNPPYSSGQ